MHFFADSELHPLIDNMSNTLASTAVVIFRVGHGYKMAGREG
jgi:S-adenosylmethionine:diacylglycerol 3-amino-3-carboxypropyl transferase